ncbi:MAG: hypothetical protein TH68_09835 [Candidatus Synechococcus spongiarum 142]|uniref:Uncharacterized protein n=1 Tax=Candidatus Synechococcus spongiarum 142 TaxID=1608213 RepID=A0A6N3X2P4_9SYNE|nr:MAG: hypothetical protein TH68_09835 [Candidatus Synechococcus spongiarum 142]
MTAKLPQEPQRKPEEKPPATQGKGARTGPWRLFKNLLLLARATEDQVKEQARDRVKHTIENNDVLKEIKNEFRRDYNDAQNEIAKLSSWVRVIIFISVALVFLAGPLVPDIFSLDVLKVEIENLKEDIKDLREENQTQN